MAHGNTIANRYCIELKGGPTRLAHSFFDDPADLVEMDVARDYLAETVGNTDERFANVGIADAAGVKQTSVGSTLKASLDCIAAHNLNSPKNA
jgi:hypothetical protein